MNDSIFLNLLPAIVAFMLKGASAGRCKLPGDLVWYTQDKGLRSYEELKSRVSNWGLQVKTYRLIYATDETCERNETRGSCLKRKYPKMVWTDLEWSREVQSGAGWSTRVWKVCGLGGQILTEGDAVVVVAILVVTAILVAALIVILAIIANVSVSFQVIIVFVHGVVGVEMYIGFFINILCVHVR